MAEYLTKHEPVDDYPYIAYTDKPNQPFEPYQLPTASDETLGGVKVGTGLEITDGVLSVDNP